MLTEKEVGVLGLVKKGLKQVEISKKLNISQPAVSGLYNNALKQIKDSKEVLKIAKELEVNNEKYIK